MPSLWFRINQTETETRHKINRLGIGLEFGQLTNPGLFHYFSKVKNTNGSLQELIPTLLPSEI